MIDHDPLHKELWNFIGAFASYFTFRLKKAGFNFEKIKDFVVELLLTKRGANTSFFVHASILGLAFVVLVGGGVFTSSAVVSGSYPGIPANPLVASIGDGPSAQGVITSEITPITIISEKPRDEVVEHEVQEGDTISTIAEAWGVNPETIYWENDLTENSKITEGDIIRILPVSGIAYEVEQGDTIYSIAKTYRANAQAILDFPFNDVGDDFQLASGQVLIIPDGAPPTRSKPAPTQYLAQQNIPTGKVSASGQFLWPAGGDLSQYFAWYHPGLDISNLAGGAIQVADSGTVTVAGWPDNFGYGNRVQVDHGNGFTTLYAHLSAIYVSPGQTVSKGDVIGAMGSTGRSTGTHLHLEIRQNGVALNPLSILGQ